MTTFWNVEEGTLVKEKQTENCILICNTANRWWSDRIFTDFALLPCNYGEGAVSTFCPNGRSTVYFCKSNINKDPLYKGFLIKTGESGWYAHFINTVESHLLHCFSEAVCILESNADGSFYHQNIVYNLKNHGENYSAIYLIMTQIPVEKVANEMFTKEFDKLLINEGCKENIEFVESLLQNYHGLRSLSVCSVNSAQILNTVKFMNGLNEIMIRVYVVSDNDQQKLLDSFAPLISSPDCILRVLYLSFSSFSNLDVEEFAKGFAVNKSIKTLYLKGIVWDDVVVEHFDQNGYFGNQFWTCAKNYYALVNSFSKNTTVCNIKLDYDGDVMSEWEENFDCEQEDDKMLCTIAKQVMKRNSTELSFKNVSNRLISFCLLFCSLGKSKEGIEVHPYVLLSIFDWLPSSFPNLFPNLSIMHVVDHKKKINLIYNVLKSAEKIKATLFCR